MNAHEIYVRERVGELERQHLDSPYNPERWTIEWRMTAPPRRAVAAWVGDLLVATGERLRRWSAPETQPVRARGALGK